MSEERYKILFNGMVMIETPEETVKANLAQLFKCDLSRIEALFGGQTVALKHNLTAQEAERYVQVLREAGAIVYKERDDPPPAAPPVPQTVPAAQPEAKAVETRAANAPVENPRDRTLGDPFGGAPVRSQSLDEPLEQRQGDTYCEVDFFSLSGRIGRIRYLAWPWILAIPGLLCGVLFGILSASQSGLLLVICLAVMGIAMGVLCLIWTIRRLHDINMSGWWALLFLLLLLISVLFEFLGITGSWLAPLLNFLFGLFLSLKSGDDGENDYGPPPPPNGSAFLYFLACLTLLVSVAGIWWSSKMDKAGTGPNDSVEQIEMQNGRVSEEQIEQIKQLLRNTNASKEQINQMEQLLRRGLIPEDQIKMLLQEAAKQRASS
jgi:uncharacterized membrane protein YhaH (DUF805 family)